MGLQRAVLHDVSRSPRPFPASHPGRVGVPTCLPHPGQSSRGARLESLPGSAVFHEKRCEWRSKGIETAIAHAAGTKGPGPGREGRVAQPGHGAVSSHVRSRCASSTRNLQARLLTMILGVVRVHGVHWEGRTCWRHRKVPRITGVASARGLSASRLPRPPTSGPRRGAMYGVRRPGCGGILPARAEVAGQNVQSVAPDLSALEEFSIPQGSPAGRAGPLRPTDPSTGARTLAVRWSRLFEGDRRRRVTGPSPVTAASSFCLGRSIGPPVPNLA